MRRNEHMLKAKSASLLQFDKTAVFEITLVTTIGTTLGMGVCVCGGGGDNSYR